MSTAEKIFNAVKDKGPINGAEVAQLLGLSRQAVNKHLKKLLRSGAVVKEGVTRGNFYRVAKPGERAPSVNRFYARLPLEGLEEDRVFSRAETLVNARSLLGREAFAIFQFQGQMHARVSFSPPLIKGGGGGISALESTIPYSG